MFLLNFVVGVDVFLLAMAALRSVYVKEPHLDNDVVMHDSSTISYKDMFTINSTQLHCNILAAEQLN